MKKRKSLKSLSVFTSLLLILCTVINVLAPLSTIAEGGLGTLSGPSINVDANKSDWADVQPSGESPGRGFSDFGIGNLYLTNDEDNLYFWIDADNVADDWDKEGESEGMYIDLAFQINSKNSENISNPWGYQFNYSGMDAKPQFHLSLRIKSKTELKYVSLDEATSSVGFTNKFAGATSANWQNAEFAINLDLGFEGKIPLSTLGLDNGDSLSGHVTLSGNKQAEHGAFDTTPLTINNEIAKNWNESANVNIQADYARPYTIVGAVVEPAKTYTINYFRYGESQTSIRTNWDLWVWEDGKDGGSTSFTEQDSNGFVKATLTTTSPAINLISRRGGPSWLEQEMTRRIEIEPGQESVEVWIIEGLEEVFYNFEEVDTSDRIRAAMMEDSGQLIVTTTSTISPDAIGTFKLLKQNKDGTKEQVPTNNTKVSDKEIHLKLTNPDAIDVRDLYQVSAEGFLPANVIMRRILDGDKYYYDGNDLGLVYTNTGSTFKVWAPTATKVSLALYDEPGIYNDYGAVTDHTKGDERQMFRNPNGVWELTESGDLKGKHYMYKVEFADGKVNYSVDPYAYAVSANGQRTAIINLDDTNPDGFGSSAKPSMVESTDAIIYELHVRDFSIDENSGISSANKGKYLAFTEKGTKNPTGQSTGVDHLKELGITHVHLLPVYDFQTVNELKVDAPDSNQPKFNWGYDPQNFNVPEGSYSTDPADPSIRINEFKQMVDALHANDIRVVMDVVYNHTYATEGSVFNNIVPGYYFRTNDLGHYTNGSGTGNEVASERPMVRKYIKDSVRFWAEEYNVDGFRFDLMGLIDTDTMLAVEQELHTKVDPNIIIYGEPWQAGGSPLAEDKQTLKGRQKDKNFAVFNDNFRSAIKGGSDDGSKGFATGQLYAGLEEGIVTGLKGAIDDFTTTPGETINYVTAHDNLNLWDKIIKAQGLEKQEGWVYLNNGELIGDSLKFASVEDAVKASTPHSTITETNVLDNKTVRRSLLSNGIVLTSQGLPFIHAGDEILRTKYGDHNSYRSPDTINQIRWADKDRFQPVFDYYKGLIELRKEHPAFRMTSAEMVRDNLKIIRDTDNLVAYELQNNANGDKWNNIVIIYNANNYDMAVTLPKSASWNVVVNDKAAGVDVLSTINGSSAIVKSLSTMVLYEGAKEYQPEATEIELDCKKAIVGINESLAIGWLVKDQEGTPTSDKSLTWTSSDETIARVDKSGRVRGIKEGTAVITATLGDISSSVDLVVRESSERFIELTYIRNNNDYDGWNLWIWNSALSNGRVDFQEVSSEGAVVRFPINQKSENVGFILRKAIGDNEWGQKDIVEDRFIETHFTQQITKLIVRQGQKEIEIIPAGTVASIFTDIGKEHWAYKEIQNLASRGVINGYGDGTFRSGDHISRAQAIVMIVNALGLEDKGKATAFSDVAQSHWAAKHIGAARQAGIIKGYADGTFRPGDMITRAQVAVMIAEGFELTHGGVHKNFKDVTLKHWAYKEIELLGSNGISSGYRDGNFGPGDLTTRGHFAVMLNKAIENK